MERLKWWSAVEKSSESKVEVSEDKKKAGMRRFLPALAGKT
jgi:hypothetical protein